MEAARQPRHASALRLNEVRTISCFLTKLCASAHVRELVNAHESPTATAKDALAQRGKDDLVVEETLNADENKDDEVTDDDMTKTTLVALEEQTQAREERQVATDVGV